MEIIADHFKWKMLWGLILAMLALKVHHCLQK